jgi:positive phototaxis protein PixI
MKLSTLEVHSDRQLIGVPYLRVQLTAQQAALLPMDRTQEAISVSADRVTPVPNMPDCVLGLLNQRSHVFWAIDLAQLLGLTAQPSTAQQYNLAIIQSDGLPLGLVVPEVSGILRINTEDIESPIGAIAPELVPYLSGCYVQAQETVWVLDPKAIVQSSNLKAA